MGKQAESMERQSFIRWTLVYIICYISHYMEKGERETDGAVAFLATTAVTSSSTSTSSSSLECLVLPHCIFLNGPPVLDCNSQKSQPPWPMIRGYGNYSPNTITLEFESMCERKTCITCGEVWFGRLLLHWERDGLGRCVLAW